MKAFLRTKTVLVGRAASLEDDINNDLTPSSAPILLEEWDNLFKIQEENLQDILKTCSDNEVAKYVDDLNTATKNHRTVRLKILSLITPQVPPSPTPCSQSQEMQLPRIKLPTFDGKADEWPHFSAMFMSGLATVPNMSELNKHYHLMSCLQGAAKGLVTFIPTSASSFTTAWDILCEKYENKRKIVQTLCRRVFDLQHGNTPLAMETIVDTTREVMRALETLNNQTVDAWLLSFLSSKLPTDLLFHWEQTLPNKEVPPITNLLSFTQQWAQSQNVKPNQKNENVKQGPTTPKTTTQCQLCKKGHYITKCSQFHKLSVDDRWQIVKSANLCSNCLSATHAVASCPSKFTCKSCTRKHSSFLHKDKTSAPPASKIASLLTSTETLLSTAMVIVKTSDGKDVLLRAVLDHGAQVSLISEDGHRRLKTAVSTVKKPIAVLGGQFIVKKSTKCTIGSMINSLNITKEFLIVPKILREMPSVPVNPIKVSHMLQDRSLADPTFATPAPVQLLLGTDIIPLITKPGLLGCGTSINAQNTAFGWIVMGDIPTHQQSKQKPIVSLSLSNFWELENVPSRKHLTPEETAVSQYITATTKMAEDGRYMVRIPLKEDPPPLGASRHIALARLKGLERQFNNNQKFATAYKEVIEDYLENGHLELAPEVATTRSAYLPHHAVFKKNSPDSALRVVFDASCRTTSGKSLNDCQANGPRLQDDLFNILIRFRTHEVVLTADIQKMYRNVWVHPEDRDLQRIVWRYSKNEPVRDYRLTTVTFGEKAAPYLAIKVLNDIANACPDPRISAIIKHDFYVDDLLTGAQTIEEARVIQAQLIHHLHAAGLKTHKWASNFNEALDSTTSNELTISDSLDTRKTLGLAWNTDRDAFTISAPKLTTRKWTRRSLLSTINAIFDPLGWLSAVTVTAKIFMQNVTKETNNWDEPLTKDQVSFWTDWLQHLPALTKICIPRAITSKSSSVVFCGFCDASESSYGAALYARTTQSDGTVIIRLVAAKTRVAPLKPVSLPRLELLGAHLLSTLVSTVLDAYPHKVSEIKAWTDSTIALAWIQAHPSRWQTFVANRVAAIQDVIPPSAWSHVRSEDNPADLCSRGIKPTTLQTADIWWYGPKWLKTTLDSGSRPSTVQPPEQKPQKVLLVNKPKPTPFHELLTKFSSLVKLRRVVARLFLTKDILKNHCAPVLTPNHFEQSDIAIYKWVQMEVFSDEIDLLKDKRPVYKKSPLVSLNPFLDANGLIRVGGRLRNAELPHISKHPIVLPSSHHLTNLIIRHAHAEHLHAGPTATLATLRTTYWIPRATSVVKRELHKCVICTRHRGQAARQLMADLPTSRVQQVPRPFTRTGVDFAGPVFLKTHLARSTRKYKAYICLFICLSTRAIHLELATALSTSAFLAAFSRFASRRGLPTHMYSDRGTNFVGADNDMSAIIENNDVMNDFASKGVQWHFNPPSAPHFGGLWEAGVKSTKTHLTRILGHHLLTYEEYMTILVRTEAALNSRPLTALSSDPSDLSALTPAHFLIGGSLEGVPEDDLQSCKLNTLSRWQLVQKLSQDIWARWSSEYLSRLQQRPKWWRKSPNVTTGSLVLIKEESKHPLDWRLARIQEVHPGQDGCVRVVTLRTSQGVLQRPIHKLCILPLDEDSPTLSTPVQH